MEKITGKPTVSFNVESRMREEGAVGGAIPPQELNPLLILPEEVWKIIFSKLESPQDLQSSMHTCTTFEGILQPSRCSWMFSKVFPHIFHYLGREEVLACRAAGKVWNDVVEDYLENHGYYRPFDEFTNDSRHTTLYLPLMDKGFGWTEFHNIRQVLSFMETMKNPVKNPFIGRAIWIQFEEDLESEEDPEAPRVLSRSPKFWPTVFQFLSLYGKYVWYFSLGTFGTKNTTSRFIQLLRGCLSHLPNLKSLHIFGWISDDTADDIEPLFPNGEMGNIDHVDEAGDNFHLFDDDVPTYLERRPLPRIASLEKLEIEYMEDLPDGVYEHLIALYGGQLKCLELTKWDFLQIRSTLPVLNELHLKINSLDRLNKFFWRLKSPLAKLNLDFSVVETELDAHRLCNLISDNFGETLRVLQMTVQPFPLDPDVNREPDKWKPVPRLRTPQLQTIQLEGFKRLNLNFLSDVSSTLKHLHLRHMTSDIRVAPYSDEVIDVYKFLNCDRLYESNIWSQMPNLKVLSSEHFNSKEHSFDRHFYRREMYEYLERKGRLVRQE